MPKPKIEFEREESQRNAKPRIKWTARTPPKRNAHWKKTMRDLTTNLNPWKFYWPVIWVLENQNQNLPDQFACTTWCALPWHTHVMPLKLDGKWGFYIDLADQKLAKHQQKRLKNKPRMRPQNALFWVGTRAVFFLGENKSCPFVPTKSASFF